MNAPAALGRNGMAPLVTWEQLEASVPQVVATMRRYLQQIGCILRPGSVNNTDLALRAFAGFLTNAAPEVVSLAQVTRAHIEDYKPWLAARPGQNKARASTATIVHRLGTLRMFFAVVLIGAGPGYMSRSASSARTGTFRCTLSWSLSSTTTATPT